MYLIGRLCRQVNPVLCCFLFRVLDLANYEYFTDETENSAVKVVPFQTDFRRVYVSFVYVTCK